jgi:hypothetical protein
MNTTDTERTGVRPALPNDAVVIRLPHFLLKRDSLFFLISQRPFVVLNQAEQFLWKVLEKEACVGALQARLGPLV